MDAIGNGAGILMAVTIVYSCECFVFLIILDWEIGSGGPEIAALGEY